MANPYRPETLRGMAATRRLQIATLIGDLWRSVKVLTADIEHEEMHSGVRNVADPNYPVLARSLRAQRDNIRRQLLHWRRQSHWAPGDVRCHRSAG
jgi:hypothetical protein